MPKFYPFYTNHMGGEYDKSSELDGGNENQLFTVWFGKNHDARVQRFDRLFYSKGANVGANDHVEHQFNECVDNIVEVLRQGREKPEIARLARRSFQLLFGKMNSDERGLIEVYVHDLNHRFGNILQDYQIRDILRKTAEECCAISNENAVGLLESMECYAQAAKFIALNLFREILRAEKRERRRIAQINLPPDCFLRARQ